MVGNVEAEPNDDGARVAELLRRQVTAPVRFVESGSIFNTLEPLPLDRQRVTLAAEMNYRKRGLVYFSGFEFDLRGEYAVTNPRSDEIDVVFVLPVEAAYRIRTKEQGKDAI